MVPELVTSDFDCVLACRDGTANEALTLIST